MSFLFSFFPVRFLPNFDTARRLVVYMVKKRWGKKRKLGPWTHLSASIRSPIRRPLRQNVEKLASAMSAATSVSLAVADAVWAEIRSAGRASDEHLSM